MKGANRSFASALRGPVITITIGVLFLLDNISGLKFGKTWPILLIVLGAMALAGTGKRNSAEADYLPEAPYPEVPYRDVPYPNDPKYPPYGSGVPPAAGSGAPPPPGVRR